MSTLDATAAIALRSGIRVKSWLITILATVVSTYALDGVATAGGVILVASGVMAGIQQPWLWVVLASSYVAWVAGLRVNLKANFQLLEAVGTSSNALSKAAYELVRRRAKTFALDESPRPLPTSAPRSPRRCRTARWHSESRWRATRSPHAMRSSSSPAPTSAQLSTSSGSAGSRGSTCGAPPSAYQRVRESRQNAIDMLAGPIRAPLR